MLSRVFNYATRLYLASFWWEAGKALFFLEPTSPTRSRDKRWGSAPLHAFSGYVFVEGTFLWVEQESKRQTPFTFHKIQRMRMR